MTVGFSDRQVGLQDKLGKGPKDQEHLIKGTPLCRHSILDMFSMKQLTAICIAKSPF